MQPYDFRLGGWDKLYLSPGPLRAISDGGFGKLWGLWGLKVPSENAADGTLVVVSEIKY